MLHQATEVHVARAIQDEWTLTFQYPLSSEKIEFIKENRLVVCKGQRYRISKIKKTNEGTQLASITATHIFRDNENYHILNFGAMPNTTPYAVMVAAFSNTPFHVMTAAEDCKNIRRN